MTSGAFVAESETNTPKRGTRRTTRRVFKAYKANQSTYTTLVGKGGQILKQWPGYSRAMLVELDEMLAKETGRPAARIDTTMAPEKMNSGWAFTFG